MRNTVLTGDRRQPKPAASYRLIWKSSVVNLTGRPGRKRTFLGDRDNAAPSVRKCLEHADRVSVPRQPELRFERLPGSRTGDLAVRPGQPERNFMSVRRDSWHQGQ
jgi:hypothetical protein